jgi:hypothetical protein
MTAEYEFRPQSLSKRSMRVLGIPKGGCRRGRCKALTIKEEVRSGSRRYLLLDEGKTFVIAFA